MDTTIDTLAIEIESDASKSSKGLDELINKLNRLSTSVDYSLKKMGKLRGAVQNLGDIGKGANIGGKAPDIQAPKVDNVPTPEVTDGSSNANKTAMSIGNLIDKFKTLGTAGNNARKKVKDVFNSSPVKGFKSRLVDLAKGGFGLLTKTAKTTGDVLGKVFSKGFIKTLQQAGLALLGVRGLFTATRKAVSEYMNYNEQLNESLRNNWAVLGSLLAPVLEKIIDLFGKAVAYINAFVQALFGIDLVARANQKSLNNMGGSAKKLKNELAGLQSFDDLHVADFKDDTSGGSGVKPLTVDDVDTSPIDAFIKYLDSKNWYMLGVKIGNDLSRGIEAIDFSGIESKMAELGTHIAQLLNGITDGLHWDSVGAKLAEGLNVGLAFASNFLTTYNFDSFGIGIASGLNSAIETLNWEALGQVIFAKLMMIQDVLFGFAQTFDFRKFGDALGTSLQSGIALIDGNKIGKTFTNLTSGLLNGLTNMIKKIDWKKLGEEIGNALTSIDWMTIFTSLFELLGTVVDSLWSLGTGIGSKIGEAIGQGFDKLKEFAESDAFTVLASMVTGLATAFALLNAKLILTTASVIAHSVATGLMTTASTLATVATTGLGIAMNILCSPITLVGLAIGALIAVIVLLVKHWDDVKEAGKQTWEKIKEVWGKVKDWFKEKVIDPLVEKFNFVKEKVTTAFTNTIDKVKEKWQVIKDWFTTKVINPLVDKFNYVKDKVVGVFTTVWTKITDIFGKVKDWFTEHVAKPIGDVFNNIWDGIKGVLNVMIGGINTIIGALNKIKIKIPNWVPEFGGKEWGFHISEIPKLKTGTNRIESEGLYHLHKNEAVVPEKYNPAVNNQIYDEGSEKVVNTLNTLIDVVQDLEFTNVVNVGNEKLYKGTVNYIKRQNNIYGTNVI